MHFGNVNRKDFWLKEIVPQQGERFEQGKAIEKIQEQLYWNQSFIEQTRGGNFYSYTNAGVAIQEYQLNEQWAESIKGGFFGALGSEIGGREMAIRWSIVDQIAMSFSGAGTPYGRTNQPRNISGSYSGTQQKNIAYSEVNINFTGNATKGVSAEGAVWAQKTFSGTFSADGKFAGQTVDNVTGMLRSGALSAADVPINVVVRNGQTFILNTRSSAALMLAGIPRSSWNIVNQTGVSSFESMLTGQLGRNGLINGTNTIRQSGTQLILSH